MGMMKRKRRLLDETGQMSIFVALIFQVLFVFFAMVVNIGLVVHDKINLQNSVDFGAYYAAQRQAEILNEIAHVNYQIRQDNKLLAWRYRVLGTLGRALTGVENDYPNLPPALTPNGFVLNDVIYPPIQTEKPSICIFNPAWRDGVVQGSLQENYCWRPFDAATTLIRPTPIIAGFVPGIALQRSTEEAALAAQTRNCRLTGPLNWRFTMRILSSYKMSVAVRKQMIYRLRRNLVAPNFTDQRDQPVLAGAKATVIKNLTKTNAESFDEQSFEVVNGLANPSCAGPANNGEPTIVEVPTAPVLWFTNVQGANTNCVLFPQAHTNLGGLDPGDMDIADPTRSMRALAPEPTFTTEQYPEHSSLGFEKNPWCMAYVGVKARTRPRKPFAPFGQPVTLEARAFAQPFGGRVGPWYRSTWQRNGMNSDGGARIDPLTSPRLLAGNLDGGPDDQLPNFSRYPGDQLGLKSKVALGAQRHILRPFYQRGAAQKLALRYFDFYFDVPSTGDPMAFDPNAPPASPNPEAMQIRKAERAAVAPDLFDITYYSIDPNFFTNYYSPSLSSGRYSSLPAILGLPVSGISDLGSRIGHPTLGPQNIESQISNAIGEGNDPELLNGDLRYVVKDWRHLLTGWGTSKVQVFTFPDDRFGKCEKVAPPEVMIPGKCAQNGGRVGYSVRLLSRDYLLTDKWNVGGDGVPPGQLRNPPDPGF